MKVEFRHQNGVVSATVITRFSSLLRSSLRNASVGFITLPPFVVFIFQLSLSAQNLPLLLAVLSLPSIQIAAKN